MLLDYREKQRLGERVKEGSYYTDGKSLYEVEMIGATGCVTIRNCRTEGARCLGIENFRARYWLVRERGS
jgi:hypothetical protein